MLAISTDAPELSAKLRERLDLDILFLSDPRGVLMDELGIRDVDGLSAERAEPGASRDLFLPTTFLLDREGVIRWAFRPRTYRARAGIDRIMEAIDALDSD